jgi:hypothetical protein
MRPAGVATSAERIVSAVEQYVDRARLDALRAHGRARIPFNASACARSAVIEALDGYVTARRFPDSVPWWEAHTAIDAKVAAVLQALAAEGTHPIAPNPNSAAPSADQARDDGRVDELIAHGTSRAHFATIAWDRSDAEEARGDVLTSLEEELDSGWSESDVNELVDEILDEWEEDPEE